MRKLLLAPSWLPFITGVRLFVTPIEKPVRDGARHDAKSAVAKALADDQDLTQNDRDAIWTDTYVRSVARAVILDWDGGLDDAGQPIPGGIGDAQGNPVKPSPRTVDLLLDESEAFSAFIVKVLGLFDAADAEKNVSSPSSAGSSQATSTAALTETQATADAPVANAAEAA